MSYLLQKLRVLMITQHFILTLDVARRKHEVNFFLTLKLTISKYTVVEH